MARRRGQKTKKRSSIHRDIRKQRKIISKRTLVKRSAIRRAPILDDRRRFRAGRLLPLKIDGTPSRTTHRQTNIVVFGKPKKKWASGLQFVDPKKVSVCRRRASRRIALFASRKIGKGKSVSRIRHRNEYSDIKC